MPNLNLLFIGDIVGKGGRRAVQALVPKLKERYGCSFVIANAENCAAGAGLNAHCLNEMTQIDAFTAGDHVWDCKEFPAEINGIKNIVRPANMSKYQPGTGWIQVRHPLCGDVIVIALMGKVFMRDSAYCPFETVDNLLKTLPASCKNIFVDFHAEATSEKAAMAWFLDGRVTAVIGTHTHVQTNDPRILPQGTAFLTDAGMVGGRDSILGRGIPDVLSKFRTGMPCRFPVVEEDIDLCGAVVRYDAATGRALEIIPIREHYNEETL